MDQGLFSTSLDGYLPAVVDKLGAVTEIRCYTEEPSCHKKVVNVSQVRQLSPFRYPGGKTWCVPEVKLWLNKLPKRPHTFIEPFGGGGIISLSVAAEDLADQVVLCELDDAVAAVWGLVFGRSDSDVRHLVKEILSFECTRESVIRRLGKEDANSNQVEKAFLTILKNRVNRGGIMAPGSSLSKRGENNRGIASRWYPETLARRIESIRALKKKIKFIYGDAFNTINEYSSDTEAAFFVDPPYTAGKGKRAGSRLYVHNAIDHDDLFLKMREVQAPFMMTYDDDPEVRQMAKKNGFLVDTIPMKSTHHAVHNELLITSF